MKGDPDHPLHDLANNVSMKRRTCNRRVYRKLFLKMLTGSGIVEYEVPRIRVPSTQQCFPEGCVQIHSLQMTAFRQPSSVTFAPYPPNQFIIRIVDFDFFVAGQLGGTISIIIQLPVVGRVQVTGLGVSVSAFFDIQKSANDEPYLRMTGCQIDGGIIQTRVADVGLLTDTINSKYQ
ncbi:hypothetical protein GCK32_017477, partial [Trichostrongylus colubriformis]